MSENCDHKFKQRENELGEEFYECSECGKQEWSLDEMLDCKRATCGFHEEYVKSSSPWYIPDTIWLYSYTHRCKKYECECLND